jgi:transcriptional regulator with XRE-family HTH domain
MKKRAFPTLAAYLIGTGSSQSDLARRLGVGQSAVNQWLRRRRTPKPHLALKLHRLTGVPFEVLLKKRPRRRGRRGLTRPEPPAPASAAIASGPTPAREPSVRDRGA